MEPILPTWFKYRQGKAEAAGENTYRLTAPNLSEAFLSIRATENGKWQGVVCIAAAGPELAMSAPSLESPGEAWEAAYELYRQQVVFGPASEQVTSEAS